jgi:hypothetical protein
MSLSAMAELTPYQASYHATFDRFSGRAAMALQKNVDTGEYTYSSVTKPRGLAKLIGKIREWSTFELENGKVIPKTFVHKSRDKENIQYDWSKRIAMSNSDGVTQALELNGIELDLLSLQMQMMVDLNSNELKSNYTVIKGNALKTYQVTMLDKEEISIGNKSYQTIKLKQQRKGSSRHSLLWLAPELEHVLVKMEQYKGKQLRGTLTMTAYKAVTGNTQDQSASDKTAAMKKKLVK